jgi:glyoxylase-like metal-dependent hydrolase (beta-lactamase superfamily II)
MTRDVWYEVGDRVFVRRYHTWHDEPFDQNIGVVIGGDGVAVIDTRASHRLADELSAELRELTRLPVAAVVNTHHHWDHSFGNARFLPAPIWGHVRCAERVRDDGERMRQRVVSQEPAVADELQEVVFTPPDRTFSDRATLDLGDRQLELRFLGRGHTDNDIVVLVPDAGVLFAGDLLENDAPPSYGDAYPAAWAMTAARVVPEVSGAVVPGHGSIGDAEFAEGQAMEIGEMAELGRAVVDGEMPEAQAVARAPFPAATARTAIARSRRERAAG